MTKFKLLFILILELLSLVSIAQPFPIHDEMPEWRASNSGTTLLFTTELETLCGQEWNKVVATSAQTGLVSITGYYRIGTGGSQVFWRRANGACIEPDRLLYDFSLQTGESAYCARDNSFGADSVRYEVYHIAWYDYGGISRKTMFLNVTTSSGGSYTTIWVEGVGDLTHPFHPVFCTGSPFCTGDNNLLCMRASGQVRYALLNSAECTYLMNLRRIYVNGASNNAGQNGSDWNTPFKNLQAAIQIAGDGDTIWVAQSTYLPTSDSNREKYFQLNPGVVILGGFNGTEMYDWERDPAVYETILSGDIGIPDDSTDNSYHVLYTIGTDSTAILDGFTITRGQATSANATSRYGGGLLVDTDAARLRTSPVIRNCRFIGNTASYGGGIYCNGENARYANPLIQQCTFLNNRSTVSGAGIYVTGYNDPEAPVRIVDCYFVDNSATWGGGGICLRDACGITRIENCRFTRCKTIFGGGGIFSESLCQQSELKLYGCDFEENEGVDGGGLAHVNTIVPAGMSAVFDIAGCDFKNNININSPGGGVSISATGGNLQIRLSDCLFDGNRSATNGGGGVYLFNGNRSRTRLSIDRCQFFNNFSPSPANGGIFVLGSLFSEAGIRPYNEMHVTNSLFAGNRGAVGYNIRDGAGDAYVNNCTFYENGSFPIAKNWGAEFNDTDFYSKMEITNSIVWESTPINGYIFYNGSLTNLHLFEYTLHHNLVKGNICTLPGGSVACGEGNIFATWPVFLDTLNGDFRVSACSPVINAGTNEGLEELLTDLGGNPRILDGLSDIGAYERSVHWIDAVHPTEVSCSGGNDGSFACDLGGSPPFTYAWQTTTGQAGDGNHNLRAGNYHFSITDAMGCSDTISAVLSQPEAIEASFVVANASAFNVPDGSIIFDQLNGGTPPYRFFWNTGDTSASLSGLLPGLYELAILDANDCEHLLNFEVSFVNAITTPDETWQLQVSPNPIQVGHRLRIWQNGNAAPEVMISVWDAQGRPIQEFFMNGPEKHLDTEMLAAGVYWLRWQGADGQSGGLKVVVL